MKRFLRENAPVIAVFMLGFAILLFVPLAPKKLWKVENIRKGPYRVMLETTEGRKEVRVTLEMDLETPEGFEFRASPLERLRGQTFPASWAMYIDDIGTATLPCFADGDRVCTFKIGARNHDRMTVLASDCQAMETMLACSGRLDMKVSQFLDISRADAVVRPID